MLTLREAIKIKYDICLRYNSASNDEKVLLFSPTVFQDVYSHIKIEKFSEFTLILPSFIVEILKVKRSLKDVFDTLKLLNNEKEDIKDITSVPAHLIAFQKNLPCFLKKISFAITTILSVINDIETVREKMKLSDIMDFSFSENEQKQIIESQEDKY